MWTKEVAVRLADAATAGASGTPGGPKRGRIGLNFPELWNCWPSLRQPDTRSNRITRRLVALPPISKRPVNHTATPRSEEHTSELQSLMRISYAVFCLTK